MSVEKKDNLLFQLLIQVDLFSTSLTSLTTTVSTLQGSNVQLQTNTTALQIRLASVENDVVILQRSTGALFVRFPKLPIELRNIIWRIACRLPQVHVMAEDGTSRSKVLNIMKSCKEVKKVVLEMKLDYFCVVMTNGGHLDMNSGTVKNYINVDIVTFWVIDVNMFPSCVSWRCGKCHVHTEAPSSGQYSTDGFECLSNLVECGPPGINRLAIDLTTWEDANPTDMRSLIFPHINRPKELLIVVGNSAPIRMNQVLPLVSLC
ncbi:uncharacterized protein PAC_03176 [Phialocephala subalpina]|uniref:2EXR domain-containing protein n=1 Tax=Phialocephala subalpina TaxID=576137 RepID=A0A1L7WKJ4_9HELO|nr:uncharacterized protein PAC_03176 [Phialocephala subalpina]